MSGLRYEILREEEGEKSVLLHRVGLISAKPQSMDNTLKYSCLNLDRREGWASAPEGGYYER